jgi:PAS domain S-box-containing protein
LPEGGSFLVIDSSGTVLARSPDPASWVGQSVIDTPLVTKIMEEERGVSEGPGVDGIDRLFAFTSVGGSAGAGLSAGIGLPKNAVFAEANADVTRNMVGLTVVAVLVLVAGWVGSEIFVLRQTRALVAASRRLASGDLSARSSVPAEGGGELNELGHAFDEMAASLERREEDLRTALAELQAVNESLEERVDERTQTLAAVNASLQAEINERRRAEQELDHLFTLSQDMICIAGFDGYFKRVNPVWEQTLGFSAEDLTSKPFIDFVHPEDIAPTNEAVVRQTEQGLQVISFENRYRCQDGSYRWLLWNSVPLAETQTLYAIARDITERKEAEEELARQAEALARSNTELDDFTHVVSHDLKEPLRIIEAFSSFLAEEYGARLDEEGRRYIDILQESAHRMRDLIDDLLQLSRLARVNPQPTLVNLEELFVEISREMEFTLAEKHAFLRIAGPFPRVECDRLRMKQLFENLISNAVKYNDKDRPEVEVGCRRANGQVTLSVCDNGPGIPPKYHDKVFGIFERLVHQDEQPGTGVGLTICKKIIDMHGGSIAIESNGDGTGTTFLVTIPGLPTSTERKERRRAKRPATRSNTSR